MEKPLIFTTKAQARKDTGLSYLGTVSMTAKHRKSLKYNEMVYSLYLAPGNTSGHEVCPGRTDECSKFCLANSGMNTMSQIKKPEVINKSRIKKTKLLFEERQFFVSWLAAEIQSAKDKAEKLGFAFSVRLNNTSDIAPTEFYLIKEDGDIQNILEIFPDTQFYEYTKVKSRLALTKLYSNYDLTFSYSGKNWDDCKTMLDNNIRVAVVFKKIPPMFEGFEVVDGDLYDMRYKDKEVVIVGLKFKRVREKLTDDIKFVIQ
jgi:hypothetical protein